MDAKNIQQQRLHFVVFPLMTPGHMIPMIDMAKLIAKQGITITIITTPLNATRFKSTIDRDVKSGLNIRICELRLPWENSGLPEGCENVDMLPSLSYLTYFNEAAAKLQDPLENLLQQLEPEPSCLITDMGFPWTSEITEKLDIPRVVFNGTSCFSLLSLHNLIEYDVMRRVNSDTEVFFVPGLPDEIELTRTQVPNAVLQAGSPFRVEMREAEKKAFGVVVNSFEELESEYFESCKAAKGKKMWCVGPVSVCNQEELDKGERGNKAVFSVEECMKWLDLHKPKSVIYACFGSLCNFDSSQVMELALGLETSTKPFILALREGRNLEDVERLMEEDGLERRTQGRGLVIKGWAPQVFILSHPSVGAFLTHCGWNSTLEGISSGLPLITCPMFSEQFLNEKLVIQVLKVGATVKVENPTMNHGEEARGIVVKREYDKRAIDTVMGDGTEGKEMRKRVALLAERAKNAVQEGGSSNRGLRLMIQDVTRMINKGRITDSEVN